MAATKNPLHRNARIVSSLTLLSRVLGLMREQLLAALLAAGPAAEAFHAAFRIPNLLRDLFAEGALSSAFVPIFSRVYHQQSQAAAYALAQRIMTLLLIVLSVVMLGGYLFTPSIVGLVARGFYSDMAKFGLTVELTHIMLPFLVAVSLASVAMGMLNAQGIYGLPAFASSAFNLVAIGCGLWLVAFPQSLFGTARMWALGVLIGGVAQFAVQLPALIRRGFRLQLRFGIDPAVREIALLMVPAVIGLSATQVNIIISSQLASHIPGAIAWLGYAFRLLYLPIGVFGVAIANISTAELAKHIARRDAAAASESLQKALRLVAFLTIPSAVGLYVFAEPIIAMLYQRRAFTPQDTAAVALATATYATGLFAYSAVKVLAPIYYSDRRSYVPLLASIAAVIANIALCFMLYKPLGFRALALGTALAAWVNGGILLGALNIKSTVRLNLNGLELLRTLLKITLAAALMGLAGWALQTHLWPPIKALGHESIRALFVIATTTLLALIYGVIAHILRIEECALLTGWIRRRLA